MKKYTVHQAKTHLSRLIEQALVGENVVIARRDKPAVELKVIAPDKRKLGFLGGRVVISKDFNKTPSHFSRYVSKRRNDK